MKCLKLLAGLMAAMCFSVPANAQCSGCNPTAGLISAINSHLMIRSPDPWFPGTIWKHYGSVVFFEKDEGEFSGLCVQLFESFGVEDCLPTLPCRYNRIIEGQLIDGPDAVEGYIPLITVDGLDCLGEVDNEMWFALGANERHVIWHSIYAVWCGDSCNVRLSFNIKKYGSNAFDPSHPGKSLDPCDPVVFMEGYPCSGCY